MFFQVKIDLYNPVIGWYEMIPAVAPTWAQWLYLGRNAPVSRRADGKMCRTIQVLASSKKYANAPLA